MTTATAVGAVSREAAEWYAIDWRAIHQNVRRLQVRIVKATKASRWNKVKSLQRLLAHSYSGKVLAVRRVSATTGFTVSTFPSRSRVSLKEAFAVLEPCAGKLACTVLRGLGPSNGVWLLGIE